MSKEPTFVANQTHEYLAFRLGAEEYGIDILKVQEIRKYDTVTRIANAPDFLKGVINLRGSIVPIIDMRVKFALDDAEYSTFTVVIILNVAARVVGIVVDSVSDVISLLPETIRPAPEFGATLDTGYIVGLAQLDDRMIIVTDIERLMTAADMSLVDVDAEPVAA